MMMSDSSDDCFFVGEFFTRGKGVIIVSELYILRSIIKIVARVFGVVA